MKAVPVREIYLHGHLRRFGRCFKLAVASPAEAVRALCAQFKGFADALRIGHYRVVTTHRGFRRLYTEDTLKVGSIAPLHIVPVPVGAGGGGKTLGIGLLVAGALLLTAGLAAPLLGVTTLFGIQASTIGLIGASMALYGAKALLAPKPALSEGTTKDGDSKLDSFLFGGSPDRSITGRCLPVSFGYTRVNCIPVSFRLTNVRIPAV